MTREPTSACVIDRRRRRLEGALVCGSCFERLEQMLDITHEGDPDAQPPDPPSIPMLFARLDPRPVSDGEGRRAPGFAAALPISAHVTSMRDRRSEDHPVAFYDDPHSRVRVTTTGGRVEGAWLGHDLVEHFEQQHPPMHAGVVLERWARRLRDERGVRLPRVRAPRARPRCCCSCCQRWRRQAAHAPVDTSVPTLAEHLRRHLDWIARQPWIGRMFDDVRQVRDQLRPATGEARPRPVGPCPNVVDDGEHTRECGAPLRARLGETVRCPACAREWGPDELLKLGQLLQTEGRAAT